MPDHSWLSKTRSRLPAEVHEAVFGWVLALIAERGLVKADRIGVDASTMEANAALRTIVRRDSGETYREMLKRMAAVLHPGDLRLGIGPAHPVLVGQLLSLAAPV